MRLPRQLQCRERRQLRTRDVVFDSDANSRQYVQDIYIYNIYLVYILYAAVYRIEYTIQYTGHDTKQVWMTAQPRSLA